MSEDLIRREDAIKALCRGCGWKETQCDQDSGFWCESGALIRRDIPSADRPQGAWILNIDDLFPCESTQECSICHAEQFINGSDDNYCPNGGARMEGADDE